MTGLQMLEEQAAVGRDERSLHGRMQWFTKRWTEWMPRDEQAQFQADLLLLIQAVHRDASRETHALLSKALAAMPAPQFVTGKPTT